MARLTEGLSALRAALMLALCLVAGCAHLGRTAHPAAESAPPNSGKISALNLVRYANGLQSLTAPELDAEHLRLEKDLAAHWTPAAALRMSLLLTIPRTGFRDDERARAYLLAVEAGGTDARPVERELASFLLTVFAERPAEFSEEGVQGGDPVDGDVMAREVDALRRALAAERARRGELEQQVKALKRIEQNLNERENAPD